MTSCPNRQRMWLDVPYAERDKAKDRGARWDSTRKTWYAPTYADELTPWLPAFSLIPGENRDDPLPDFPWVQPTYTLVERMMPVWDQETPAIREVRHAVIARSDYRCERCCAVVESGQKIAEHYQQDASLTYMRLDRLVCLCYRCLSRMRASATVTNVENVDVGMIERLGYRIHSLEEMSLHNDVEGDYTDSDFRLSEWAFFS